MIRRIRTALQLARRRKEAEAALDRTYEEVNGLRPKKAFRQRDWFREVDALDLIPRWLVRAATVQEIEKRISNMQTIVAHCQALVETEAKVAAAIETAQTKADALRQRSARLQGTAFKLAEHRHHAIKDECNHARRARDARAEEAALQTINQKMQTFEGLIMRAETVTAALPEIEARLAAIKPEEIWLDTGAKETYDDLLATFAETQRDVKRGDYDKAAQRLREIEALEANLRDRGTRRADWAQQEIAMWRSSPSIATAFPELSQFQPKLSTADIETLYGLREQIERFVATQAADQRENNMPSRDIKTGSRLAATHPLRMPLDDACNPAELEEFLRCVTSFGR